MSQPFPFRRRRKSKKSNPIQRTETPWARAWRTSPQRMKEHLQQMNQAKVAKSEQTAELVQAILNMISTDPVAPYKMRETFRQLWKETYDEDKTSKESWNLLRLAMRHGKIGKTENGLIYPRHA
jgi:hypothetical protein